MEDWAKCRPPLKHMKFEDNKECSHYTNGKCDMMVDEQPRCWGCIYVE